MSKQRNLQNVMFNNLRHKRHNSMTEVPFDPDVTQIIYTVYTIAYLYDLRYVILHYKKNPHKILPGRSFISIIE